MYAQKKSKTQRKKQVIIGKHKKDRYVEKRGVFHMQKENSNEVKQRTIVTHKAKKEDRDTKKKKRI